MKGEGKEEPCFADQERHVQTLVDAAIAAANPQRLVAAQIAPTGDSVRSCRSAIFSGAHIYR